MMADDFDQTEEIRDAVTGAPVVHPPELLPEGFDGNLNQVCANFRQSDLGNSRRFYQRFGQDLIYVRDIGWHSWDGRRWDRDRGQYIAHIKAQETVDSIHDEAEIFQKNDPKRAAQHNAWGRDSASSGRISALQREAIPHLLREGSEMDARPDLLTCDNGTIELGVMTRFRESRRDDLLTRQVPVDYDVAAVAPVFESFLEKILPDKEIRDFVQMWFGYILTGHMVEQVVLLFWGQGQNGKSTLLNLISDVCGDLQSMMPISSFAYDPRRRGSEATPDMARLPGVRMVTASEPEIGMTLSEAQIKEMTGGENLSVRHLHKGFFEFKAQCKITLAFNNRPKVRGQDKGTWRRFLVVPFEATVDRDDVGPVYEAFEAEKAGIFQWLINGAERWYEAGKLIIPDRVREETYEFRSEQDLLSQFFEEYCITGNGVQNARTRMSDLFNAWKAHCRAQGEDPGTRNLLGRKLKENGLHRERSDGVLYRGIELNEAGKRLTRTDLDRNTVEVRS